MRLTLIFLSAVVCLIVASMTRTMRGFGWQVHHAGDPIWQTQNGHGWAEKGSVPPEWDQIKSDPEIDAARLYTSAQQRVRADRRRSPHQGTSGRERRRSRSGRSRPDAVMRLPGIMASRVIRS